ncbi:protein MpEDS5 [Marchantia polymorpha subsp. ruderalis]|uniref:Protein DETOXIFICATION n=2 Tax=Marchantia polymorpha TaxID=3197 RepID=A0AAF6ALF3_MARPO|nr:hypothetical protein MARPO_0005s0170 [Marchantia polymorpha]BBM97273.1 hypothetical protein Mp_1g04370 [Marchantia polymorpha subsp. ruderalis]|eukprot:PTQ48534.1 hypothetical protein MARPO_0005s0170 [Marchantia polymorpha]
MGGGAAQLLHSPVYASEFHQLRKSGERLGRATGIRALCAPGHSRGSFRANPLVNSHLITHEAQLNVGPILSNRRAKRIHFGGHGRANKSRIFCSADNASEFIQLPSEFSPELIRISGIDTDVVYSEAGIEGLKILDKDKVRVPAEEQFSPSSNVEGNEERIGDQYKSAAVAAAAGVFDVAAERKVQDNGHASEQQEQKVELDQEILESMENQEAAAALIGSGDETKSLIEQMREILVFAGPALGIWLSGPLMSIIDTAVVGQSSSLELAALGPGTVLCDQLSYVFMFLSISTSNLIATALAHKDEAEAAGHLSRLLFISLFCGVAMMLIIEIFSTNLLQAFVGVKNYSIIPAARTYVQIRALAWPIVLVGMVSQSASLGMKDSWGPLKVLAIASGVNLVGDIVLCSFFHYGIAGAAWATMASQYIAGLLMLKSLGDKGYNPLAISVPSWSDLSHIMKLAAPILLSMLSKVCFYTLITYLATSMGALTLAAHQVMIGVFSLCTVWGEPLAQTAQSFMPALIYGTNRNLKQARSLLRTLIVIGMVVGVTLGCLAVSVPWLFPGIFTSDPMIISQMRAITLPFFLSLMMTPPTLSCEGTLLAGRDLKFLGYSMASCFLGGSFLLLLCNKLGVGLAGSWWTLVAFQSTRFVQSYTRLSGPKSVLADEPLSTGVDAIHAKAA